MSPTNDFDIGPLSWVKPEIDATLNRARESLEETLRAPGAREHLRFAQGHMHQASGALSLVGLDGVAQFAEAIDKLLAALVADDSAPPSAQLSLIQRGIAVLANYLNELMAGAAHLPLRLFPVYRELVTARGGEEPAQSELFFPDLSVRPSLTQVAPVAPERAAHELRVLRGKFEKGLLGWIRKPSDAGGPTEMLNAVRRIEQISSLPATRAFWWAAIAYFEGLAQRAIAPDRQAHRLCRRIDTQMRRLIEGSHVVAERLVRDVLYFVASAKIQSEHAQAVRNTYKLEQLLPGAESALSDTLRQPLLMRMRESLEHVKEAWNRFCAGAAVALPLFQEQLEELQTRIGDLKMPQLDRLLSAMVQLAGWLRADPLRLNDEVAMEVATSLLVLEQAADSPAYDQALLARQVELLCRIYAARCAGSTPEALDDALFGEASQRAQERLFFNQLAREILTNLGQIEQTLDSFFRHPDTHRESLNGLSGPLKQIEGAFSMMGEAAASDLVHDASNQIANLAVTQEVPSSEECEALAHNLSALGFYVEALKGGPAQLERFLNPGAGKSAEQEASIATETVETQLARETRETHNLAEALKEAPEDRGLRQQLVSNLEAIREDAHLLADSALEQQTKDAIASLKAGNDVVPEQLDVALAGVVPTAVPQPSAEASRLMQVSSEELDKELLGIFLEEANEVLATQSENREQAAANPHDVEALTTVRRGFHTLKGSSRMVGLMDFSEAARHVELTMNRWLQLEKDAAPELLSLIDNGIATFTPWVKQLEAGGSLWFDASSLIAQAEALLGSLDTPADDVLPMASAPTPALSASSFSSPSMAAPAVLAPAVVDELLDLDFDLDPNEVQTILTPSDTDNAALEFDAIELPDEEVVNTYRPTPTSSFEASLEATRLDPDALRAFELDEPPLAAAEENLPELDLTSTVLDTEELGTVSSSADQDLQEIDLTATLMDGDPFLSAQIDFELADDDLPLPEQTPAPLAADVLNVTEPPQELTTTALDFELDDGEPDDGILDLGEAPLSVATEAEPTTPFAYIAAPAEVVEPVSPPPFPEYSASPVFSEPPPVEGEAQFTSTVTSPFAPMRRESTDEGLQIIAIDEDDGDEDELPHLNLNALSGHSPTTDSVASRVAELVEVSDEPMPAESFIAEAPQDFATPDTQEFVSELPPPTDSEVNIGGIALSRGLYELYLTEASQHMETLRAEQVRIMASPLHVPEVPAMRAAHTLAGISGTARMEPVLVLARGLEHALHRFEELAMAPDSAQAEVLCNAITQLDIMVAAVARQQIPEDAAELAAALDELWPHQPEAPVVENEPVFTPDVFSPSQPSSSTAEEASAPMEDDLDEQLLPIFFEEAEELTTEIGTLLRQLKAEPGDQGGQQSLARVFHTLKGSARMAGAMRLGDFVHALETRLENATSQQSMNAPLVDELENGLDQIGSMIEQLRNPVAPVESVTPDTSETDYYERTREEGAPLPPSILMQAAEPAMSAEDEAGVLASPRSLVRVKADMVDRFVNEAGEISIARTRVEGEMRTVRRSLLDLTDNVIRLRNQLREVEISAESQMQSRLAAAESQHANFDPLEFDRFTRLQELTRMMAESVGDVTTIQQNLLRNLDSADAALHAQGRLSRDLQQALMSVRMVPFEDVAERLYRVVRQTAKELGKRANLDIRGGRIEIDRGVLDKMVAPIEHLLRNAIAHGLESPEERVAAGKADIGQITLSLTQMSNEIALEMSDDGRGLNFDRILARGRATGLIGPAESPSDNRLTQLIFEPGFSTAETVSGISGRGVGMDVVKNETLSVGGRIDTSTTPGQGTRFLIHLPLTLAVTQALLVYSAERTYAIPSNMVEQALEMKDAALQQIREQGYAEWKEIRYPLRYLPRLLGDHETQPVQGRYYWILLLRAGNTRLALQVDELRGNQEIIVKNAGPQFVRLQGFTGATVLPDGEISLILNPVVLADRGSAAQDALDAAAALAAPAQAEHIPTIMVVDDSLTVRKITSRLLEREGYQVVTAKDGVDALEQLVDSKPDVMLLDIEMPRMDGFDLARNVRADEKLRNIPIIMITSRMADKHRNYAFEIGVNHYLGKPYQEDQLLELIAGFVRQR